MALVRRMVYFPVCLAAYAGLVAPPTASAHLVTSGIGPFYDGVVHFLVSPEDLAVVLALAAGLAQLGPVNGRPLFGYASSFATIIGASLLVPAIIFGLARVLRAPLARLLGVEGLLAHANLAAAIPRLSISVAALAVSLSMMVAVAVMIGSFRDTVAYWIGQTLQADLFIGPGLQPR